MRHLARWALCLTLLLVFRSWIMEQAAWYAEHATNPDLSLLVRTIGALLGAPSLLAFSLFSRIDESRALEQASRQRLREAIRQQPGIGLSELSKRVGLGWGTTVYHLNRLERVGLVASDSVGRRRAFFLPEHGRPVRQLTAILGNEAHVRLLRALHERPDASQRELAHAAGLGLPLANRYLRSLEAQGLVQSRKEWRERRYLPTPHLMAQWPEIAQRQNSPRPAAPLPLLPTLSPRGTNVA